MRRMTRQDDRGAVTLFVVLMMPVLLLFAAFVLDGGRGLVARRQTQNAADAGALAKATDCAKGISTTSFTAYETNGAILANTPVCGAGTTTVSMSRNNTFAFGPGNWDVTRSATAKWGALAGSTGIFPLSVAYCAVQNLQFGQTVTLHSYDTPGCTTGNGQFGWIASGCSSDTVVVGDSLPGTTGNNPNGTGCGAGPNYSGPGGGKNFCVDSSSPPDCFLGTRVLVPVWDTANHIFPGNYPIIGYATFLLTGWSDNGNNAGGSLKKQCDASADGGVDEHVNKPCIRGTFIEFVTQNGTPSPGPSFGTQIVHLSS